MTEDIGDIILTTKLYVPRAPAGSKAARIERSALSRRLDSGAHCALTLLSAPAGFGKTTLLAGWAVQKQPAAAWLSLDAEDNFPPRFLTYLAAAIHSTRQISDETMRMLRKSQNLPPRTMMDLLLQELENARQPFWLVLDDYHLIVERQIHDLMQYLLEHRPPALHLVIATRADPPIPVARLRSRGELFELRAADLRLSSDEAEQLLNHINCLGLNSSEIEQLQQRTEGWAAGLQMAALALKNEPAAEKRAALLDRFSGSHRFILDYLMEEVFTRQPREMQQFLLRASLLDRFCAELCAAVTPAAEKDPAEHEAWSQEMLNRLERDNLFLVPIDDERRWYRFHHLFGDLMRVRLQQTTASEVPTIHRHAAHWFEQHGEISSAVRHAIRAGDFKLAADWLATHGQERWANSDTAFLSLVEQIPMQFLTSRPELGILRTWTAFIFGQMDAALSLISTIHQELHNLAETPENQAMHAFVDLLEIYFADLTGSEPVTDLPAPHALAHIPPALVGMRNTADVILGMMYSARCQFDIADALLAEALRRDDAAGGTTAAPLSISLMARNRIVRGHLREAEQLCRAGIEKVSRMGAFRFYLAGNLYLTLSEVLIIQNRLEEAGQAVREGLALNEPWNTPSSAAMGAAVLARLHLARGDSASARQIVSQAVEQLKGRFAAPEYSTHLLALQASLWLEAGDLAQVETWARSFSHTHSHDFRHERSQLVLVKFFLAQGRQKEALALLQELEAAARAGERMGSLVRILLTQALAFDSIPETTGGEQQALACLEECLKLAGPEGYLRVFLNEGEPARRLLQAYLRLHADTPETLTAEQAFARRLLDSFEPARLIHAEGVGLVEALTPREIEVLGLLSEGLSNQAIAERLTITLSAVKKHTGNIFGKLEVTSRTQAAARARELGLVK